jgi:hypothetical protein
VIPANDPEPAAPIPLRALLAVGLLLWALLASAAELGTILPRTPEQEAVAIVVERVIVASQSEGIARVREPSGEIGAVELAAMHARVRQVADELLTGAYHDRWIQLLDEAIDLEASTVFSGGADTFTRWHLRINGTQASVRVRAQIFLELAQTPLGHRSVARNTVDFELSLSLVDGTWRVGVLEKRFAPGGGP